MKQTAIEFYRKNLYALVSTGKTEYETENEIFEQAKEMEKEQIIKANENGKEDVFDWLKKMDYDFLVEEIIKSE